MVSEKLKELRLELPKVVPPVASYVPAKKFGNLIYVSGQIPMQDGKPTMTGPMTNDRNLEEAQKAMALCFLNGLAAATTVAELDEIKGVVRLGGMVASAQDFTDQHKVANGASDLAKEIFGERGIHARAAFGAAALPLGVTVELEILFHT